MGSLRELVAGGAGGASMVVVGHPLDTVKVRMQASDGYRSALHCVIRTSRAEGPLALYKGMIMPLGATSAVFALCFSGYEHGKRLLGSGGAPSVREAALAGAFSALYTTPVQAPQELLKCRMQKATGRVTVRAAFGELWASGRRALAGVLRDARARRRGFGGLLRDLRLDEARARAVAGLPRRRRPRVLPRRLRRGRRRGRHELGLSDGVPPFFSEIRPPGMR